jgi:hypothetical protein
MFYVSGITKSVISARIGNRVGTGKVEVKASWVNETGVDPTGKIVDAININGIEIPEGYPVSLVYVDGGHLAIFDFDKKCSVQIPGLGSIYFLNGFPKDPEGLEIKLGDWIDIPPNVHAWPEGTKAPEQVLCRSKEDPKHYKLYKYRREIEGTDWEDTGLLFGGTFTAESWERFRRIMASFRHLDPVATEEGQ